MTKFDGDAAFRGTQEAKYGGRDGYSSSVLGVVETKIAGARAKAGAAADRLADGGEPGKSAA